MIKLIKEVPLFNAGYVKQYDFSEANSSEESRIEHICAVARVCRGDKTPVKSDKELYQQLLTEHDGKPGSVFEFVPHIVYDRCCGGKRSVYGYVDEYNDTVYTNLRSAIEDENSPYVDKVFDFFVFKIKVPQMIVKHILRHRMLSFQEMSERTNKLREYYYCDEFEPILKLKQEQAKFRTLIIPTWNDVCRNISIDELDRLQKQFKIPQEKLNKGEWGLRYTTLWISAWNQDLNTFSNFFNVRCSKPAQAEIITLANTMKQMMEE